MVEADSEFITLYIHSLIPLYVCLVGLSWVIHDYFVTLEDEIRYIWSARMNFSKAMFLWIRYYTLMLLIFDAVQIHAFTVPGVTSDAVCVAMDTVIRVVGALSLWSVEIVMQQRVYAIYQCSKRIAAVNATLFAGSIAGYVWILVYNHARRSAVIAAAIRLPLPGCPSIHSGIEWAQWVPATIYEGILFGYALVKTVQTAGARSETGYHSLLDVVLRDNVLYFFVITCILVFNNLMVVSVTHIPWFSYGPFHAAVGILTTRLLIHLRKAAEADVGADARAGRAHTDRDGSGSGSGSGSGYPSLAFAQPAPSCTETGYPLDDL